MIQLVQLLCPKRHAIMGCAYDPAEGPVPTFEEAVAEMKEQMKRFGVNPWCGICGSRDLRFEHGVTRFKTMAEAMPDLKKGERDQLLTRAQLDAQGRTYDARGNKN